MENTSDGRGDTVIIEILSFLTGPLETFLCLYLLMGTLGSKYKSKWILPIGVAVEFLFYTVVDRVIGNPWVGTGLLFAYMLIYSMLVCRSGKLRKILSSIGITALYVASDIITGLILMSTTGVGFSAQGVPTGWYQLIGIIISKTLFASAVFVVLKISKMKEEKIRYSNWIPIMLVPVSTFLVLLVIFDYMIKIPSSDASTPLVTAAAVSLYITNLLVFYAYNRLQDTARAENKLSLMEQQADLQHKYNISMQNTFTSVFAFSHDIKNHLTALAAYLEGNKPALDYLNEFGVTVHSFSLPCQSGILALDALINEKYLLAKSSDIRMEVRLHKLRAKGVDPSDLCTIVGNALDNAIEGCKKVEGERVIKARIAETLDDVIIVVHNSVSPEQDGQTDFKTTKKNKKIHGFGLKNIKRVLEKYNGLYMIKVEDGVFKFSACVSVEQQDKTA